MHIIYIIYNVSVSKQAPHNPSLNRNDEMFKDWKAVVADSPGHEPIILAPTASLWNNVCYKLRVRLLFLPP